MPFSSHREELNTYCKHITALPEKDTIHTLSQDGLQHLLIHCNSFDRYIAPSNPFLKEFLEYICSPEFDRENIFSLFECLVIFLEKNN